MSIPTDRAGHGNIVKIHTHTLTEEGKHVTHNCFHRAPGTFHQTLPISHSANMTRLGHVIQAQRLHKGSERLECRI